MPRKSTLDKAKAVVAAAKAKVPKAPKKKAAQKDAANSKPTHRPHGGFAPDNPYAWQPGQSGNPSGRPRTSIEMKQRMMSASSVAEEVFIMAAQITLGTMRAAHEIMHKPPSEWTDLDKTIVASALSKEGQAAAREVLDRAHGKPKQPVEMSERNAFDKMAEDELHEWLLENGTRFTAELSEARKNKKQY